jgi:hypothetical protein
MPVDDPGGARSSEACAAGGEHAAKPDAREPLGIPIPGSVSAPSFYVATFALGVVIGIAIALYWRP